jgi:MFS family permease
MASKVPLGAIAGVVGFLVLVEFTSGILQGYYVPLLTDIARFLNIRDGDVNFFEGAQLMVSALVVPALAKLGDMVGHKRMLLVSTAITAVASVALAFSPVFWVFLVAWALQGAYVVWLPLEVALVFSRSRSLGSPAAITRKAAGFLVAGLELGVIAGALGGGAIADALFPTTEQREGLSQVELQSALAEHMWLLLIIPAVCVVICFFVILFGVKESPDLTGGRLDYTGLALVSAALLVLTAGLSFMRVTGPGNWLPWTAIALGVLLIVPFVRYELKQDDPLIDIRMFRQRAMWPILVTAGLFGVSVLGAQAPLSTFARTNPDEHGFGLGASGGQVSILIGIYVVSLLVGALVYPQVTRLWAPRRVLMAAAGLIAVGYFLFIPLHDTMPQLLINIAIAGIGSGALVAALPSAAAAVAPRTQTGVATGLTNTTKTIGGAFASCVFGIALISRVSATGVEETAGTIGGYYTVWIVCGVTALVAAVLLAFVPKGAFEDKRHDAEPVISEVR